MKTIFQLLLMYDGKPVVPVDRVASDFFELSLPKFLRKCSDGSISLPIVRMEDSQKSSRGVPIKDLADYIDARIEAARKEQRQLAA